MSVSTFVQRRVLTAVVCRTRAVGGARCLSMAQRSIATSSTCSTSSSSAPALVHRARLLSFFSPLVGRSVPHASSVGPIAQRAASSTTPPPHDASAAAAAPKPREMSPEERARREAEAREASERYSYDDGASEAVRRRRLRVAVLGAGATLLAALPMIDYFTNQELKACGPYKSAMRIVVRSPLVEQHLGHPIREGYRVSSKRNANKLRLEWTISSGNKSATVVSTSVFVNRQGSFTELYLLLESGERVDLLDVETPH